jgi:hypothetical protein
MSVANVGLAPLPTGQNMQQSNAVIDRWVLCPMVSAPEAALGVMKTSSFRAMRTMSPELVERSDNRHGSIPISTRRLTVLFAFAMAMGYLPVILRRGSVR